MNLVKIIEFFIPDKLLGIYRRFKHNRIKEHKCDCFPIVSYEAPSQYESIYHIKDETWEEVSIAKVYKFTNGYNVLCWFEAQDILLLKHAKVCNGSDIVITSDGVIWDKYYSPNFSKVIPWDKNMYDYENGNIWLRKYKKKEQISGRVISLLGVHAAIWAHFLVQYLPKLYYAAKAGVTNEKLTILTSPVADKNIQEIYDTFAASYPNVMFREVADNTYYDCEELLYMPSASRIDDHSLYFHTCDAVIPKTVRDVLMDNIVKPIKEKVKKNPVRHRKLYIVRRDTFRKLINWQEIEEFFKNEGFYLVEGHSMTIEEKADLFYHAEIIVGPYSSGWTNTMFCNGAKGLMFVNIPRTIDAYQYNYSKMGDMDVLMLTGDDTDGTHPHLDSYIPLDKVKRVYQELMSKNFRKLNENYVEV